MERRRFTRIIYNTHASLRQHNLIFIAMVKNISLQGLLLTGTDCQRLDPAQPVTIHFSLPHSDVDIYLIVKIVNATDTELRVKIVSIDIDSISQLKRLVELNLKDAQDWSEEIERLAHLNQLDLALGEYLHQNSHKSEITC